MAIGFVEPSMAYHALDRVFAALEASPTFLPFAAVAALTNAAFYLTGLLGTQEHWHETVALPRLEAIGLYPHIVSNLNVRCAASSTS
jgi:hypothetical protein